MFFLALLRKFSLLLYRCFSKLKIGLSFYQSSLSGIMYSKTVTQRCGIKVL